MNGLFALIEKKKTPFYTVSGRADCVKWGNNWLIFEGKLFNRNKLIQNYNLNVTALSDADVVLELFVQKNTSAFALLEGYWSLIIADLDKQTAFAARDHFGNNHLYYCKTDTQFGIASECRVLLSSLKNVGKINKNAIFDFLLWGDIGKHQQNFFLNIHELKPSNYLFYSLIDNTFEEKPYYILPYKNCKAGYNEYEEPFYIDKTRQLILDSVQNNTSGRNKMAIIHNGGIDSSALLCCAKKLNPDLQLIAFTQENLHNERESFWTEKIIKHANAKRVKVFCDSKQIIKQLQEINKAQSIPVFNVETVAQHCIMEAVSQHGFDVVMSGKGANELFAGHTAYFLPFLKSLRNQWMFKNWIKELVSIGNSDVSYKEIIVHKLKKITKKTKLQELSFLNEEYKNCFCSDNNIANKSVLNDYLYESYTVYLPYILRWKECAATSFGIESLFPFANSKALTEYIFSVPSTFKIHNGWTKYLLRSSMVGIVPDEIRWQKQKLEFYTPEKQWLNEMGNEIKKYIYQLDDTHNFVNKNSLLDNWENLYTSNNFHFQQFVFRYYSYLVWSK